MSPLGKNGKSTNNKELQTDKSGAYKPAYKEKPKTAQNQSRIDTSELPSDLTEIVTVWPELPEHIKAAIKAFAEAHRQS